MTTTPKTTKPPSTKSLSGDAEGASAESASAPPPPVAQVIPFAAPEYTIGQFIGNDLDASHALSKAFAHEISLGDKHITVKRTRAAWRSLYNEWLTRPRG